MIRCYVGYDPRDDNAYKVCTRSLRKNASVPVEIVPLYEAFYRKVLNRKSTVISST